MSDRQRRARRETKAGLLTNPTVARVAAVHGVSPASVLLRWNLQRGVVVIPKSVTPARIRQNLEEPWSFRLSEQELAAMATVANVLLNLEKLQVGLSYPKQFV